MNDNRTEAVFSKKYGLLPTLMQVHIRSGQELVKGSNLEFDWELVGGAIVPKRFESSHYNKRHRGDEIQRVTFSDITVNPALKDFDFTPESLPIPENAPGADLRQSPPIGLIRTEKGIHKLERGAKIQSPKLRRMLENSEIGIEKKAQIAADLRTRYYWKVTAIVCIAGAIVAAAIVVFIRRRRRLP